MIKSNIVKKLRKSMKANENKPHPPEFKPRLDGPSKTWKIFKLQQQAIDYAFSQKVKDAMVFSYERREPGSNGKRLYLATSPQEMWLIHSHRLPSERCSYEVIPENFPCKLYFDLEFDKSCNTNNSGTEMVEIFIKCICYALNERYGITCDKSQIIWLNSSTDVKFSCHLIFVVQNAAFKNNYHAGKFVFEICKKIKQLASEEEEECNNKILFSEAWPHSNDLKKLYVKNRDGKETLFCDLAVYSKNRNFRLYLSTKYGKRTPLVLAEENQYQPECKSNADSEIQLFLDSLITYVNWKTDIRLLTFYEENADHVLPSKQFMLTSFVQQDSQNFTSSPFPKVDDFIFHIVTNSSKPGCIRRCSYYKEKELLIYDIANYRYCENIRRHHKSNNIMFIVDISQGLYYQKCYDPDCRAEGFKSKVRHLPADVISQLNEERDGENNFEHFMNDLNDMEEETILQAVARAEKFADISNLLTCSSDDEMAMVKYAMEVERDVI